MSWASDDPEQYDRVCIEGILTKMARITWNFNREKAEETLYDMLWTPSLSVVWNALCDWASKEIRDAEGDYFGGLIDDAKERMADQGFAPLSSVAPVVRGVVTDAMIEQNQDMAEREKPEHE